MKQRTDKLLAAMPGGFEAALVCEERVNYIDTENTDWMYRIGRYNRPHGISSAEFFAKMNALQ